MGFLTIHKNTDESSLICPLPHSGFDGCLGIGRGGMRWGWGQNPSPGTHSPLRTQIPDGTDKCETIVPKDLAAESVRRRSEGPGSFLTAVEPRGGTAPPAGRWRE
jgi:hypothetical protein